MLCLTDCEWREFAQLSQPAQECLQYALSGDTPGRDLVREAEPFFIFARSRANGVSAGRFVTRDEHNRLEQAHRTFEQVAGNSEPTQEKLEQAIEFVEHFSEQPAEYVRRGPVTVKVRADPRYTRV